MSNEPYGPMSEEILERAEEDQRMRKSGIFNPYIDRENTKWIKEVVSRIGWPTISKVGEEASRMAWLLVQHAYEDPDFQRECLALMKKEPKEEVDRIDIAYLEDRIRVLYDKKPQLYGTQFKHDGRGNFGWYPIEDPENLDKRRKEVGLGSFEEYRVQMEKRWKEKNAGV